MKAILEARGDDADNALMPFGPVETDRTRVHVSDAIHRGQCFFVHSSFDFAPGSIELVELPGERSRRRVVVGRKACNADRHVGEAPRRVQTWPHDKAQIVGSGLGRVASRRTEQRRDSGLRASCANPQ